MWALYDQITLSAPVSLTSAAVKLRLLADPHLGLENNEGENDVASLRQVLELVARVVGAGDAELRALLAEYQRRDRSITERDISEEEVARRCDLAREVRDKIDAIRPTTLRGVLAVLDHGAECQDDPGHWPAQAVEGLREIVGDAEARP
jgi:hypothetical protein